MKSKSFLKALIAFAFTLLLIGTSFAEDTTATKDVYPGAVNIHVSSISVDTNETRYSTWFSVPDFIGYSFSTYPVNYTKIQTSDLGKPHITVAIEGSDDQSNIVTVDTLGHLADSLETLYTGTTVLDKDTTGKKFLYYRFKFVGRAHAGLYGNRSDAIVNRVDLLFTKPKN